MLDCNALILLLFSVGTPNPRIFFCNLSKYCACPLWTKTSLQSRTKCFNGKKTVSPKWDPVFLKDRFMLGGMIYFNINRFWSFSRVLLASEISLNRGPHFSGMPFLHINTPYDKRIDVLREENFVVWLHNVNIPKGLNTLKNNMRRITRIFNDLY